MNWKHLILCAVIGVACGAYGATRRPFNQNLALKLCKAQGYDFETGLWQCVDGAAMYNEARP